MTSHERLWTGITLSLFLHFMLLNGYKPTMTELENASAVTIMNLDVSGISGNPDPGLNVEALQENKSSEEELADQRRKIYLRYLDAVDCAIHARRLLTGDRSLIGVARCAFTITADGNFHDIHITISSGNSVLDAAALRAVQAASGSVRRPEQLGSIPLPVSFSVKYQYGLE